MYKLSAQQLAWRVAQDIPNSSVIYLGEGLPQQLLPYLSEQKVTTSITQACEIAIVQPEQLAANGDFHSTHPTPQSQRIYAMTELFAPNGMSLLVEVLSAARTGTGITRLYTDLATFELVDEAVLLRELCDGLTLFSLQAELDVEILVPPGLQLFNIPLLN